MQDITVFNQLGLLPEKPKGTSFYRWFNHYKSHLIQLFDIFKEQLHDVFPFSEKDLESKELLLKFSLLVYKNSSGVLK